MNWLSTPCQDSHKEHRTHSSASLPWRFQLGLAVTYFWHLYRSPNACLRSGAPHCLGVSCDASSFLAQRSLQMAAGCALLSWPQAPRDLTSKCAPRFCGWLQNTHVSGTGIGGLWFVRTIKPAGFKSLATKGAERMHFFERLPVQQNSRSNLRYLWHKTKDN